MLTRWQAYQAFCKRIWIYRRSLRSRFVLYLISVFGIMTSAVLVLLTISGLLNPLDHDLETFMNHELNNKQQELNRSFDNLAAHGIILSQQLSEAIVWTMQQQGSSLRELNGKQELLQGIQMNTYNIVTDAMEKTSCSGLLYAQRQPCSWRCCCKRQGCRDDLQRPVSEICQSVFRKYAE